MKTSPEQAVLADQIRVDHARRERGDNEWRAGTLDLCIHLAQARGTFSNDRDFSAWLKDNKLDVLSQFDRAAAIAMGLHPETAKEVLDRTERRSLQYIHREEFKTVIHTNNHADTDAPQPAAAAKKKDGTSRKKAGPKTKGTKSPKKEHRDEDITPEVEERLAKAVLDEDKTYEEAAKAVPRPDGSVFSNQVVIKAVAKERGRREAKADPPIDVSTLPLSAQEKLEAAKRQLLKAWEREKEELIRLAALKLIEELLLPHWKEKFDRAERIEKMLSKRRGLMSEANYKTILACLHPDNSASTTKRNEAFRLFSELKDYLVTPAGLSPNSPKTFPSNVKEMMAQAAAMREAARKAASTRKEKSNGAEAT